MPVFVSVVSLISSNTTGFRSPPQHHCVGADLDVSHLFLVGDPQVHFEQPGDLINTVT